MPTIIQFKGWRLFFYTNENNEPIHVHCRKGEMECKYWIDIDAFAVDEAMSYNMNSKDKREIKQIIFENFELIEKEWNKIHGGKSE